MSRSQFFHIFKELTGLSPYQYHLVLKLGRARQLLQSVNLPLKRIARMWGFSSTHHFSKFVNQKPPFRQGAGETNIFRKYQKSNTVRISLDTYHINRHNK